MNLRITEMLGYETDEMLGNQLIDFMTPEMVSIAEQQLDRGRGAKQNKWNSSSYARMAVKWMRS